MKVLDNINYIMGKMTEWLKVGGSLTGPLLGANQAQVRILFFLNQKAYNKKQNSAYGSSDVFSTRPFAGSYAYIYKSE